MDLLLGSAEEGVALFEPFATDGSVEDGVGVGRVRILKRLVQNIPFGLQIIISAYLFGWDRIGVDILCVSDFVRYGFGNILCFFYYFCDRLGGDVKRLLIIRKQLPLVVLVVAGRGGRANDRRREQET